ncbi:MAG: efflux RND transporter periplasmic adaptor subunit [Halieaceae bacterium]|mgnify:CR=1 FL=1|jgi:RND family efflux transporter MFP subunit|nr:efflux RND transporter periplasmic adaptor subunit [Halieaceae bacterium]
MKKLPLLLLACTLAACNDQVGQVETAVRERATSVTVERAELRDIDYVLTALGSVESIHHPTISAETNGQVISVDVSEGQSVDAGKLLASVDNTLHQIEAAKAEAELKRQSVLVENQSKEVTRLKRLHKSQSVSRDRLEDEEAQFAMQRAQQVVSSKQWELAQYLESKTRVLAPQAGQIARRHVSLGDYVTPGMPLFDLVSVDRLKARLSFPEHDVANITLGKEVRLTSPIVPEMIAIGEVTAINPQINIRNRAIEVTVEFDNPGGWLPGASVDATLVIEIHPKALTLPTRSIVTRNDKEVVFVVDGQRARMQEVKLGWREVDWVEIIRGIQAEDRVVVNGAALISDGSQLVELK